MKGCSRVARAGVLKVLQIVQRDVPAIPCGMSRIRGVNRSRWLPAPLDVCCVGDTLVRTAGDEGHRPRGRNDRVDRVADRVAPERRSHFYATASLVLSVALVKSTADILIERTEATVAGDYWEHPSRLVDLFDVDDLTWFGGHGGDPEE